KKSVAAKTGKTKNVKPSSIPHPALEKIKAYRKAEYDSLVLANADPSQPVFVEYKPDFPGGPQAMMRFLKVSIRHPATARRDKVSGRVIGSFVVDENGEITDPKIIKSVRWDIDQEYMRVIKSMPAWIPGFQNGKAVKVVFTVPV